jgi:type III secretion protein U
MSENKTEEPSSKRLREARERGEVARSRALSGIAPTAAGLIVLLGQLPEQGRLLARSTRAALIDATALRTSPTVALHRSLELGLAILVPVLLAAMAAAVVAGAVQVGIQLNLALVGPKLERLDPAAGLKKLFSARSAVEVLRSLVALAIVSAIAVSLVRQNLGGLVAGLQQPGALAMLAALSPVAELARKSAIALLVLGGLDLVYQRHAHHQGLMMSREEKKQEHKSSEGDPHHKAARKRFAKELLAAAGKGVRGATAVVVNPTHVAVAILYDAKLSDAPIIVARGTESEALRIRLEARRHAVPIVKDIPLARALVKLPVGEEVPEELYLGVAAILKVVLSAPRSKSMSTEEAP